MERIPMSDFENRYRKWHTICSYIKSGVRLVAAAVAVAYHTDASYAMLVLAGGFFLAELIGILEEAI
jgi:hypothetical protein